MLLLLLLLVMAAGCWTLDAANVGGADAEKEILEHKRPAEDGPRWDAGEDSFVSTIDKGSG